MLLSTFDEVKRAAAQKGCTHRLSKSLNHHTFVDPNSNRRVRAIQTNRGYKVSFYHSAQNTATNLITDADRRNEPPPRKGKRGPKPKSLFTRLIEKIEIPGADPELKWSIPEYSLVPRGAWPEPLQRPWKWTGPITKPKPKPRDLLSGGHIYSIVEYPLASPYINVDKTRRPARLFYELLIGDLSPRNYLKPLGPDAADPMNVNPTHYKPHRYNSHLEWAFTPADFEVPPEELDVVEELPDLTGKNHNWTQEDIVSFADNLEEKILFGKIKTYEDFRNHFQPDFEDFEATEDDIRAILEHANLLKKWGLD